jgi:N-acetylglucosaminyl-diphospho-decaprenol L-rhamnosyltransferase
VDPTLVIAIVTHNSLEELRRFFPALAHVANELDVPVVAVDNASEDGSVAFLESSGSGLVLRRNTQNLGYAAAVNQAFAAAPDCDVLLLNPDVEITEAAQIQEMHSFLNRQPRAAVVAPKLIAPDGSVQSSARPFPSVAAMAAHSSWIGRVGLWKRAEERYLRVPEGPDPCRVDWAIGAAMLIRRLSFEEVGGWDTGFFLYLEDTDFCMRCRRAGWETWYLPSVGLQHLHPRDSDSASGGVHRSPARRHHVRSALRFFRRYPKLAFRSL